MSDVFGPCPLCGCPREYDHLRESLLCVGCGAEFPDIGEPPWHPAQVVASTREAEEQVRTMSDTELDDAGRRRGTWVDRECDGLCVTAADIGIPSSAVAYPHPGCPRHAPHQTCECGQPDRCLSPTHGQVSMVEARRIRDSQKPGRAS